MGTATSTPAQAIDSPDSVRVGLDHSRSSAAAICQVVARGRYLVISLAYSGRVRSLANAGSSVRSVEHLELLDRHHGIDAGEAELELLQRPVDVAGERGMPAFWIEV